MDLSKLAEPFGDEDIEWRIQQVGESAKGVWAIIVPYVDNRAIQDRLDEVCGPENWCNEFKEGPSGGVLCGISIKVGDEWVTKWDGADNTDVEPVKGGLSNSMKRTSVQWGMSRELYDLPTAFAKIHANGAYRSKVDVKGEKKWINWDPPTLDELCSGNQYPSPQPSTSPSKPSDASANGNSNGQSKFEQLRQALQQHSRSETEFLAYVNSKVDTEYGELRELPEKFIDKALQRFEEDPTVFVSEILEAT